MFCSFDDLKKAGHKLQSTKEKIKSLESTLKERKAKSGAQIARLQRELVNPRSGLFGWLHRSDQSIKKDLADEQASLAGLTTELSNATTSHLEVGRQFEAALREHDEMARRLRKADRAPAEQLIAESDTKRIPFVDELSEIEAKLTDIRTAIIKDAMVVGATCTKTFLAAKDLGQVDFVIIDEASMVLLPMVWFAAGLSKERVVICGDFRQLPPIVPTQSQAIFDVLGPDVFTNAGLTKRKEHDNRMVMLDTQYRMQRDICELISQPMYSPRKLQTEYVPSKSSLPPHPFEGTLSIVDTSDLWPFESVNAHHSRFNLMHALLVRNLAWYFADEGYVQNHENLSICTPYSAQARLIQKLIETEDFEQHVHVDTVHSFQGDERQTIVLEFPEGYGGAWRVGQFLQGIPPDHVGARLINVAVSRAKAHLIVVANLTYLDRSLPSTALLRGILYRMQRSGTVVSGTDLLALRPIKKDLKGLIGSISLDVDASTMGLFNGPSFEAVESDILLAEKSIVIFSGFVTPGRVAKLGDLLRLKISEGVRIR